MKTLVLTALLASACSSASGSTGAPVLAEGGGIRITEADLQAQLDGMAPPVRQLMQTPARKKQLLDNLIRLEVIARAAQADGLVDDPSVQFALKRALAARYHDRFMDKHGAAGAVSAMEVQRYYETHLDDFSRPGRVHIEILFVAAEEGSAARPVKLAEARALLSRIRAGEGEDRDAFEEAARQLSDDPITRPLGGDIGFKAREELAVYGKGAADAVFAASAPQTLGSVFEAQQGLYLLRVVERQAAQTRPLSEVQAQIASRLAVEHGDQQFEDWVKKLRDSADIRVRDEVSASPRAPSGG